MRVEFKEISTDKQTGVVRTRCVGYYMPENPLPNIRYMTVQPMPPQPPNYNVGFKGAQDNDTRIHLLG